MPKMFRILLIDDNTYEIDRLRNILESQGVYEVVAAYDCRMAMRHLEKEKPFDLILTDYSIPLPNPKKVYDYTCAGLIHLIRNGAFKYPDHGTESDVPIIVLTGHYGREMQFKYETKADVVFHRGRGIPSDEELLSTIWKFVNR